MSYTYYCLGLADISIDWKDLRGDVATAYAIGSLDRLHMVKLPRCRKEVEDAIEALSDSKNHCGNNLVCAGFATQSETPSAAQWWQERCNRLQAERDEYHNQLDAANEIRWFLDTQKAFIEAYGPDEFDRLCKEAHASKLNPDGTTNLVSVNSAILCAMTARLPAPKAK